MTKFAETTAIARAREGDQQGYRDLVEGNQQYVRSIICRYLTGDTCAAEEVTQDAFVRAFRGLAGFRRDARFRTWVTRIAVRLAHTRLGQRRSLLPQSPLSELRNEPESPGTSDPAEALALWRALDRLRPEERLLLLRRWRDGVALGEIAAEEGIPIRAARTVLKRAA